MRATSRWLGMATALLAVSGLIAACTDDFDITVYPRAGRRNS